MERGSRHNLAEPLKLFQTLSLLTRLYYCENIYKLDLFGYNNGDKFHN